MHRGCGLCSGTLSQMYCHSSLYILQQGLPRSLSPYRYHSGGIREDAGDNHTESGVYAVQVYGDRWLSGSACELFKIDNPGGSGRSGGTYSVPGLYGEEQEAVSMAGISNG